MSRNTQKFLGNNIAIEQTLVADLADLGTLDFNYPTGYSLNSFLLGQRHELVINGTELFAPNDFTIVFAATVITITNRTGSAFLTGQIATLFADVDGNLMTVFDNAETQRQVPLVVAPVTLMKMDLGQPITADVNGIVAASTAGADGVLTLITNTPELTFTMDTPVGRNITAVSADAGDDTDFTVRVVGLDTVFNPVTEDIAMNGTTPVAGIKTFSSVESVTFMDNTVTPFAPILSAGAINVGFANIYGLPLRLANETHQIEREFGGDVILATGTFVEGSIVPETNTSPDKRGTFSPVLAANGVRTHTVYMWVVDDHDGGYYEPVDRSRHNAGAGVPAA